MELDTGYWILDIGYWILANGGWLFAFRYSLLELWYYQPDYYEKPGLIYQGYSYSDRAINSAHFGSIGEIHLHQAFFSKYPGKFFEHRLFHSYEPIVF